MNATTMNRFDVHSNSLHGSEEIVSDLNMINDEEFTQSGNLDENVVKKIGSGGVNDDFQGNVDDDDDDDSDDENAHLKQLRPGQNGGGSIRRNDSFTSFLTRSERNSILGKDPPPTEQEASKRRIRFRDTLVDVIEFDKVDKEVKNQYWMTDDDFDRIETDIKMTQFRYENSKTGKIPFDEVNNSIRGLESVLYGIDMKLYKHRQSVLQEIHQQKSKHGYVKDWEKVRHTSEINSDTCRSKAVEIGKQDELEHKKAWGIYHGNSLAETTITKVKATAVAAINETKKKNPLLFWKRK